MALDIQDEDRPIIRKVLERTLRSPEAVKSFLSTAAVSEELRGSVGGGSRKEAVASLLEQSLATNELPVVLFSLATDYKHRDDIRQLLLTIATRPGWKDPEGFSKDAVQLGFEQPQRDLSSLDSGGFERLTTESDPFLDIDAVRTCLTQARKSVCFVRRRGGPKEQLGTAFLVSDTHLLTCYHVVEKHLSQVDEPQRLLRVKDLEVVFDYAIGAEGKEPDLAQLESIPIDDNVSAPFARYSAADATFGLPGDDELDFVLLKLTKSVSPDRGSFDLKSESMISDPEIDGPVIIAQHPGDPPPPHRQKRLLPMKISLAQPGIVEVNSNKTRVSYSNGTLPGSSGSPVFDRCGRLVAMHHNKGPFQAGQQILTENNRGIPIKTIIRELEKRKVSLPDNPGRESLPAPGPGPAPENPEMEDDSPKGIELDNGRNQRSGGVLRIVAGVFVLLLILMVVGWAFWPPEKVNSQFELANPENVNGPLLPALSTFRGKFGHESVFLATIGPLDGNLPKSRLSLRPTDTKYSFQVSGIDARGETVYVSPSTTTNSTIVLEFEQQKGDSIYLLVGVSPPTGPDPARLKDLLSIGRIE